MSLINFRSNVHRA